LTFVVLFVVTAADYLIEVESGTSYSVLRTSCVKAIQIGT
jgi:hypothetical protein